MKVPSWLAIGLATALPVRGEVLINEIMYNPVQGQRFEYVELTNSGTVPVNLGGWAFTNGIEPRRHPWHRALVPASRRRVQDGELSARDGRRSHRPRSGGRLAR